MEKEKMMLNGMSKDEKKKLLAQLQEEEKNERIENREAYEALRAEFMCAVEKHLQTTIDNVVGFKDWLDNDVEAFIAMMRDYGQVKKDGQSNYTITDGNFRIEVKSQKVKRFDERADMAAERLIEYLKQYITRSEKGSEDPMYQLAMTLLSRNRQGELDYKSISKLYELEDKFDEEYSDIMNLFRESNVVQSTAINYYFSRRDKNGVWQKLEPSFCRL